MRRCGATLEECEFLARPGRYTGWVGQRVELNAMTSDQFIDWIERKLTEAGVRKVVPPTATLDETYRTVVHQTRRQAVIDAAVAQALAGFVDAPVAPPADLRVRVAVALPLGIPTTWVDVVHEYAAGAV